MAASSSDISRAVIPAAGFGTRMLPAAKAVPKEMLPILDRPTIQYVVEEAADAGLSDVLLITSPQKRAIEDHFDRLRELEQRLSESGRASLLAGLNALLSRVTIHSVQQSRQLGLGDAVNHARRHVGNHPFVCLLGDTIFSSPPGAAVEMPAAQLVAAYREFGTSIIGLEEVAAERVDRYGIIGGQELGPGVFRVNELVEKPAFGAAPSRLAIAARYLLTPAIFECLDKTQRGKGNEVQLTDGLRLLLEREPIHGVVLRTRRHDIGNPTDWLKTNLLFSARDPALWAQIEPILRDLLSRHESNAKSL